MLTQAACVIDWDGYDAGGGGSNTGGGGNAGGSTNGDGCGRIGMLRDDFDDGVEGAALNLAYEGAGSSVEMGGRLQLVSADDYGSATSGWGWDLRDGFLTVEVPTVPPAGNTSFQLNQAVDNGGSELSILVVDGEIFAQFNDTPLNDKLAYSTTAHRFWRIGESAGTVYFRTSPDGVGWDELATKPVNEMFPVDIVYVTLQRTGPDSDIAEFDNLEGGPATTKGWCAPARFADDFDDEVLANYWEAELGDGGTVVEAGGTVTVTALVDGAGVGIESAQAIDMRGGAVRVEIVDTTIPGGALMFFRAGDSDRNVKFLLGETDLVPVFDDGGNANQCDPVPLTSVPHRWLQIREDLGSIIWETSSDGTTWTEFCKKPAPSWWDASQVAEMSVGVIGPGEPVVEFDNVNLF